MQQTTRTLLNVIFFVQVLLLFLFFFEDRLTLPTWLQVAGRLHPAMVHLPIGAAVLGFVLALMESELKKKAFNRITLAALLLISFTASISALFGLFLGREGDYGAEALSTHRNSGIILSFLCYFLLATFYYGRKRQKIVYYVLGIATALMVVYTGHTGANITHGENFVIEPLRPSQGRSAAEETAFEHVIYPILEKKCTSCHNQAKAKGKFIMTSMEEFLKGGKHGVEWVPGKPSDSRMIQNIHLPLGHDDHMPPDGKPQLTAQEIKLLELWIASGADVTKKLTEFPATDSFRIVGSAATQSKPVVKENAYSFSAASEETIQKMNTPFRAVFPLHQNSPALQADFFIRESFKSTALEELKEVREQLVVLNLSRMPVTDDDLKVIGSFPNLEKLNLNFSKVTGTGLSSLAELKNLSSLSLAGTAVTAGSLAPVLRMASLRELFVWNTKVTEEEKSKLAAGPNLSVYTTQFKDDQVLRLGKPSFESETVVKKGESVVLRHSMPGAVIRYTLDGTKPDSVHSKTYDKPIELSTATTIKAIACRPGWYCSQVLETTCFVEGYKPASAMLLTKPEKSYPGEGDKSLVDGRKGFIDVFKEPAWLGYQNDPFVAAFDFGSAPPTLTSIVISYGSNVGSHIMPPEEVEVWASRSSRELTKIQTMKIVQPTTYDPAQIVALSIPLKSSRYSYYKLVAKPVAKLPKWHSGKGKKGWVFIDEVFFY